MKDSIRHHARQLGFDDCRFTHACPPSTAAAFQRWLDAGCHGTMAWMSRSASRRVDPRQILPSIRSIITLAVSYHALDSPLAMPADAPQPKGTADTEKGVVARYAQARDYHKVLREPLNALARQVDSLTQPGERSLAYVDTGPILERDLAARAGLGFVGKHTNLVHRRLGNWLFLAEILTPLALEPDAPEPNRCGHCTRCLAACPTQAITAPFELDARRCIAYLTIELKDAIPVEWRSRIGARVFGCDDCLEACPWNRFAREGRLMKDARRPELARLDLQALLELDEAGFQRLFAGTPLERSRRRGLQRNACVALGNVGGANALPALRRLATGDDTLVAEHAAWAVQQIEGRRGRPTATPA